MNAAPTDMQLISKYNKNILFLLCVIDFFSKYIWVFLSKDNKGITITNEIKKVFGDSGRNLKKKI